METEILQELQLIRLYVFILMISVAIWVLMKFLESSQRVFTEFKRAWDANFERETENILDEGKYEKIIKECNYVLEKYPNHLYANWFIARAYYYNKNNTLSKEYFEKTAYLAPSWSENVNQYIEKLNER